ncbi:MAG: hypothetical protein M1820_005018 [Bogoriella megaspora]|nr:MAG: hypothetical protein M1820_005018 [Bogoriella megaspora]
MPNEYPGDDVISDAVMVYDNTCLVRAAPENIWPWILQVGKGRGGWYLTSRWEQLLPTSWRATRSVEPQWQTLQIGDRVPDYGKDEYFDVVQIEPFSNLVFAGERYGTVFTWALILQPRGTNQTEVYLRFRGRIRSTGWRRRAIIKGGQFLDWATTAPMLAGLAERAERTHVD